MNADRTELTEGLLVTDRTVTFTRPPCRRCGSILWRADVDACAECGLTGWASSSKRRLKLAIHYRRSTWNRRKARHGRQVRRSLSTV